MFEFVMRKSGYNFDEEVFLALSLSLSSLISTRISFNILIYRINLWMNMRFMKVATGERDREAFQLDEWNIKCEFLMLTLTLTSTSLD